MGSGKAGMRACRRAGALCVAFAAATAPGAEAQQFEYQDTSLIAYQAGPVGTGEPCPAGYKVTGGGISSDRDFLTGFVSASFPATARRWEAHYRIVSAGTTTVTGYEICARRGAFKSYELVQKVKRSAGPVRVKAKCPRGTQVIGGGSPGGANQGQLLATTPGDGPDRDLRLDDAWTIRRDPNGRRRVAARAVCVDRKASSPRLYSVVESSEVAPQGEGFTTADCFGQDQVTNGGYAMGPEPFFVNTSRPEDDDDGDSLRDDGWIVFGDNPRPPGGGNLNVTTWAVCADTA